MCAVVTIECISQFVQKRLEWFPPQWDSAFANGARAGYYKIQDAVAPLTRGGDVVTSSATEVQAVVNVALAELQQYVGWTSTGSDVDDIHEGRIVAMRNFLEFAGVPPPELEVHQGPPADPATPDDEMSYDSDEGAETEAAVAQAMYDALLAAEPDDEPCGPSHAPPTTSAPTARGDEMQRVCAKVAALSLSTSASGADASVQRLCTGVADMVLDPIDVY
jgi:hypothetical protein